MGVMNLCEMDAVAYQVAVNHVCFAWRDRLGMQSLNTQTLQVHTTDLLAALDQVRAHFNPVAAGTYQLVLQKVA